MLKIFIESDPALLGYGWFPNRVRPIRTYKTESHYGWTDDVLIPKILSKEQWCMFNCSEYMFNRLRRRIAEAEDTAILDGLRIYFRNDHVKLNEYGAVPDWPKGLFETSAIEIEKLVLAAAGKRKKLEKQTA